MSIARHLDLDPTVLGEQAAGLFAAAQQLGHTAPRFTADNYVHSATREGQFLVDLITGSTDEMVAKYGSGLGAIKARTPGPEPGWGTLRPPNQR